MSVQEQSMLNDIISIGSAIAGGAIGFAVLIPKILSGIKRDKLDSSVADKQQDMVSGLQKSYEQHLEAEAERHNALEARVTALERENHEQAIKITRLIVVVLHLKALLEKEKVPLSEYLKTEINELTKMT